MAKRYHQIVDGEWVDMARKHTQVCCDCGLAHTIQLRRNPDGTIDIKYTRDNRETAAIRRGFKFEPADDS